MSDYPDVQRFHVSSAGLWIQGDTFSFSSWNANAFDGWLTGGFSIGLAIPGRGHYSFGWDEELGWNYEHLSQEFIDDLLERAAEAMAHPEHLIPWDSDQLIALCELEDWADD